MINRNFLYAVIYVLCIRYYCTSSVLNVRFEKELHMDSIAVSEFLNEMQILEEVKYINLTTPLDWDPNKDIDTQVTEMIASYLHTKDIACDDFFKFTCHNIGSSYDQLYPNNYIKAKYVGILKLAKSLSNFKPQKQPTFMRKAHTLYKSCMKLANIDYSRYMDYLSKVEKISWPLKKVVVKEYFNYINFMAALRKYGFKNVFFDDTVKKVQLNKTLQSHLVITVVNAYTLQEDEVIEILEKVGMETNAIDNLWEQIQNFQMKLSKLQSEFVNSEDNTNEMRFKWLQKYVDLAHSSAKLGEGQITIESESYIERLESFLSKYSTTFTAVYLQLQFLAYLENSLPHLNFIYKELSCTCYTKLSLRYAMYWYFENLNMYAEDINKDVENMFANIVKTFAIEIKTNWNEFTKKDVKALLHLLQNINIKVGNLPRLDTINILNNFYEELDFDTYDFYGNQLQVLKMKSDFNNTHFNTFYKDDRKKFYLRWRTSPFTPTPYYLPASRVIIFPHTFLQYPFYHINMSDYYKYSSVGFVLGHELYHGFDMNGLLYDASGFHNTDLYISLLSTSYQFKESLLCLANRYGNLVNERSADQTAIKLIFKTFQRLYPNASSQTVAVGKKTFTLSQLFFINFANKQCSVWQPSFLHGNLGDRVRSCLKTLPSFSKTFGCLNNDEMYLEKYCSLW